MSVRNLGKLLFTPTILLILSGGTVISGNDPKGPDSLFLARKTIDAVRITTPPKIDGILNEPFWATLPAATDFVEYSPRNGTVPTFETQIRFAYDDVALYISAVMYDPSPDSICRELGRRDQIESLNTDYISFDILPYNDALNMYEFKVSPAGLQNDCKYSAIGQDINWDAVWESSAVTTDSAWIVEVKIPYSALRFPKAEQQTWGINMWRNLQRRNEFSTWCYVDNKDQEIFRYYGEVYGMEKISPPVRLSFTPYVSGYVEKNPDISHWSWYARGGMDLRWGITQSYTLDMMLIPDFGQVQSDDQILNLSPFEVRYDEKRQFFTEATEMFDKCGIFYTRRVGGTPRGYGAPYDSLREGETVSKNPDETWIINATKISGRNAKGFGVGLFNGMTTNTWGTLQDTNTGEKRRIMTQPFTNYNVLVFDQNLKNNSYVTLINTNYWIPKDGFAANVTGAETKLCNKKNTFSFIGRLNVSQIYSESASPDFGHNLVFSLSKPSGKFQYWLQRDQADSHYDPNDMGFLMNNNYAENQLQLSYNINDPFWKINKTYTDFLVYYATLYEDNKFKELHLRLSNYTQFSNFWSTNLQVGTSPLGFYDYYEPRTWGYKYKKPYWMDVYIDVSTDMRKTFQVDLELSLVNSPETKGFSTWLYIAPMVRISDRASVSLSIGTDLDKNSYGWVTTFSDSTPSPVIIFGRRDLTTINTILTGKYIFSTKASLTLRVRHYWSMVKYLAYYDLQGDGSLKPSPYTGNNDINFNAFTADLQFIWYFAPGSELSVVWKNAILTQGDELIPNYFTNFSEMIASPQTNSFSVRILYYLDYLYLKKAFTGKKRHTAQTSRETISDWIYPGETRR